MNAAAVEARREYARAWREKNREHINEYQRKWNKENPDKVRAAKDRYWEKKAAELEAAQG